MYTLFDRQWKVTITATFCFFFIGLFLMLTALSDDQYNVRTINRKLRIMAVTKITNI